MCQGKYIKCYSVIWCTIQSVFSVHAVGGVVIVDATFATPVLLQPLRLGVDAVMHSCTKFLNGHSDAMGGGVCG